MRPLDTQAELLFLLIDCCNYADKLDLFLTSLSVIDVIPLLGLAKETLFLLNSYYKIN